MPFGVLSTHGRGRILLNAIRMDVVARFRRTRGTLKLPARMEPAEDMGRIVIRQTLNALFTDEAVAAAS